MTERTKLENDMIDPKFRLLKAVIVLLNERVARGEFKNVSDNRATKVNLDQRRLVEVDSEIDLMFECPGILFTLR